MAKEWPMLDALVGGTHAMRAAGNIFLPKWPAEDQASYNARLATATLFPSFSRTSGVMAAKPLARPITLDKIPAEFEEWLENIDLAGTNLHGFVSQIMLDCLQKGLSGVLVEYPKADGIRTRAEEMEAGTRPYLTRYPAGTILGWRVDPKTPGLLLQLRLLETVEEPEGEFGVKQIKQVRVLIPGAWQVWRKRAVPTGNGEEWAIYEEGPTTLDKIPFVFFYGTKCCFGCGMSPLIDLAYLNVEHWQSSSDQQTILHVARVPILFAKGFNDGDNLVVGAATACRATNPDADLTYVEHTGAAIAAGRQSILDLEDRMRQTGAELLVQKPMTTTATQVVSEGDGNRSTLQRIVEAFEDSLETCLNLMGEWIGQKIACEVLLYKDFGAATLSDQSANVLLTAEKQGVVSKETAFNQLQRSDIVPHEVQYADELVKIEADRQTDIKRQAQTAKALADAAPPKVG